MNVCMWMDTLLLLYYVLLIMIVMLSIDFGRYLFFGGRYVGELALLPPDGNRVRISVLDFWGRRQVSIIAREVV